jgi:hypothetical protein
MHQLLFVDDRPCSRLRPCSFNYALFRRSDVLPILLRTPKEPLGREYLELTSRFPHFSVDVTVDPSIEASRFREWCVANDLEPTRFCCMSEPRQEYWQAFARALGLGGLSADVARAVRHKPTMKRWIRAAGLPTTEFAEAGTIDEVLSFGARFGYPIVLKPVDGFGALWTFIANNEQEAMELSPELTAREMMVERFIDASEYECCALIADGVVLDIYPSIMPSPPVEAAYGALNANISIGPRVTPPVEDLREIVQTLVTGFKLERGYLHLELFATAERKLVAIGELALRYPGCEIAKNHGLAYGFDIADATLDVYLGLAPNLAYTKTRSVGDLLLPYKPGRVTECMTAEELLRMPGVIEAHMGVDVGDYLPAVTPASFNCSGWAMIEGEDPGQVEQRMNHVLERYYLETEHAVADLVSSALPV